MSPDNQSPRSRIILKQTKASEKRRLFCIKNDRYILKKTQKYQEINLNLKNSTQLTASYRDVVDFQKRNWPYLVQRFVLFLTP